MKRTRNIFLNVIIISIQLLLLSKSNAQKLAIDSLVRVIESEKDDTVKINNLNQLAFQLLDRNNTKALEYALQGATIAENIKWQKGLAYAYRNIGLAKSKLESPNAGIEFYLKSLRIAELLDDHILVAICNGNIGNAYYYQSNYPVALDYFRRASAIIDEQPDYYLFKVNLAISSGNIQTIFTEYPSAIANFQYAVKQSLAHKLIPTEIIGVNNLSGIYIKLKSYNEAVKYGNQTLLLATKYGYSQYVILALGNLGEAYRQLKKQSKARKFYFQSLTLAQKNGDKSAEAKSLLNIGSTYDDEGNYTIALSYFQKASLRSIGTSDEQPINAKRLTRQGLTYFKKHNYNYALKSIDSSLLIAKRYNLIDNEVDNFGLLRIIFDTLHKVKSAYIALKKYDSLYKTQIDKDTTLALIRLKSSYELAIEKLNNKVQIEEKEKTIEKEKAIKNFLSYTTLTLAIWLIAFLIVLKKQSKYGQKIWVLFNTNTRKNLFLIFMHCIIFLIIQLKVGFKDEDFLPRLGEFVNALITLSAAIYWKSKDEEAE